jgi:hypothetical protein
VKHFAKRAIDVSKKGPVFIFEVTLEVGADDDGVDDDAPTQICFAYLGGAHARHGRHADRQIWTLCNKLGDQDVFEGTRLELATDAAVPYEGKDLSMPLTRQRLGKLRHFVEDDFSAMMIKCLQEEVAPADMSCPIVTLQALVYESESLQILKVLRLDGDFQPIIVANMDRAAPEAVEPRPMLALEDGGAGPRPHADFADIFDDASDEDDQHDDVGAALDDVVGQLHEMLGLEAGADIEDLRGVAAACLAAAHEDFEDEVVDMGADPEVIPVPAAPPNSASSSSLLAAAANASSFDDPALFMSADDYAKSLGLDLRSGWHYFDRLANKDAGYLRVLPSGASVKALCLQHPACSWFLNIQGNYPKSCKVLIRWLQAGLSCSSEQHSTMRQAVTQE